MTQTALNEKKNFLSRTFSRCLAEMCPGVVRLEYHFHEDGSEAAVIRFADGSLHQVEVTGLDLQSSVAAVLAVLSGEVA